MASEKIIVSATDSGGNSVQRTFDNVNPDATNAQLAAFGSKIAAFSENTYAKTDRITRVNCDSEASPSTKQTPTLTVSSSALSCAGAAGTNFTYSYDGDGQLFLSVPVCTNDQNFTDVLPSVSFDTSQPNKASVTTKSYHSGKTFQFLFGATETDNYKAPEPITMTLTIS